MRERKWTLWVLVGLMAAVMIGAPLSVYAGSKMKDKAWPMADTPLGRLILGNLGRLLTLRAELNLTGQQKEQIRDVLKARKAEIAREARDVWQKRNALRDLVLSEKAEEEQIRQAALEVGKAIGDVAVLAHQVRGEIAPILTEEQRQRIREFRKETDKAVEEFFQQATQEKAEKAE